MIKDYSVEVVENKDESPTIKTLRLKFNELMKYETGQYLMIKPNGVVPKLKPYSIASSYEASKESNIIDICIKRVPNGTVSNYLCDLKQGDKLEVKGPYGMFILKDFNKDIIFIACGAGIGPIRAMTQKLFLENFKKQVYLFFGNKIQDEIIYRKEFENIKNENFKFIPILSREDWEGEKGYVQNIILKYIKDLENYEYYICGTKPMVEDTEKVLLKKNVEIKNIHREKYV